MVQVFPYGGVEIMHAEKGQFKVNAQRMDNSKSMPRNLNRILEENSI